MKALKRSPRVPHEVYLGPRYRVTVLYVSQQVLAELQGGERPGDEDASVLDGYWSYEAGDSRDRWIEGKIYIEDRGSLAKRWETYRHEMKHALADVHDQDIAWERERRRGRK